MALFPTATEHGFMIYAANMVSRSRTVLSNRSHDADAVDLALTEMLNLHRLFHNLEHHVDEAGFDELWEEANDVLGQLNEIDTEINPTEENPQFQVVDRGRIIITKENIRFFKSKGYTNVAIARIFGVSRQTIHNKINEFNLAQEVNPSFRKVEANELSLVVD
jgi:hypothetical protein